LTPFDRKAKRRASNIRLRQKNKKERFQRSKTTTEVSIDKIPDNVKKETAFRSENSGETSELTSFEKISKGRPSSTRHLRMANIPPNLQTEDLQQWKTTSDLLMETFNKNLKQRIVEHSKPK
jgi:hypothetical protein